jgi:hypothetical protein
MQYHFHRQETGLLHLLAVSQRLPAQSDSHEQSIQSGAGFLAGQFRQAARAMRGLQLSA